MLTNLFIKRQRDRVLKKNRTFIRLSLVVLLLGVASGCTTLSKTDDPSVQRSTDPLEGFNRGVFTFNATADRYVLRPAARAYSSAVPKPARIGVNNFFANLGEPVSIVNNLFQGKVDGALKSTYRFAVNSTIGIFGLIDVAKLQKVERQREDFGQTLAAWGVKPGPFLMVPFWGPTNLRDGFGGIVTNSVYFPINEITDNGGARTGLTLLNVVAGRAQVLNLDKTIESQPDPYLFLKTIYDTNRLNAIYDGDPPRVGDGDPDDDF